MGQPKAGLPAGGPGSTFASAAATALHEAGLGPVTVVAGAHLEAVREAVAGLPFVRVLPHTGWAAGQLSSLQAALADVVTPEVEGLMVTLVDCPLVLPDTVRTLVAAWRRTGAPIVRPAFGDRHGHPVIFDRATFEDLRCAPVELGAKAVLKKWAAQVLNVPVTDAGVLADIDTPDDYARFRRSDDHRRT